MPRGDRDDIALSSERSASRGQRRLASSSNYPAVELASGWPPLSPPAKASVFPNLSGRDHCGSRAIWHSWTDRTILGSGVLIAIFIMVAVTIALAARMVFVGVRESRVPVDRTPDEPLGFGYRMSWLAVRSSDTVRVGAAVGLTHPTRAGWRTGLGAIYGATLGETHVYVTPPVDGWTFVVGLALPHPLGRQFADKCTPFLLELASQFSEVQYFATYPTVDYFAWARFAGGRLQRAFAIGEEGVVWNRGAITAEERTLGLKLFELRGVRDQRGDAGGAILLHPTEAHVLRLADFWSVDPTRIAGRPASPRLGLLGLAPRAWRPQRLQRAA